MSYEAEMLTDESEVRADFIPKAHYIFDEVTQLENQRLWPCVWQVACRLEELPKAGDFVRYDVADQSVLVVRTDRETLTAFHNVCPHRGNELASAPRGHVTNFYCSFHGWRFDLAGNNIHIKDHEDWAGCAGMAADDLGLSPVQVGVWGGFVFINMDPAAEPLETFLDPVPQYVDCVELDRMRFKRRVTVSLKAKWITGITSFMESYHVYTTHPQLKMFVDDVSVSRAIGKHGNHGYPDARPFGAPSSRTGLPMPDDIREGFVKALGGMSPPSERNGVTSDRSAEASLRILSEVPPGTPPHEVHRLGMEFLREAAEAEGAGWPTMTAKQAAELGIVWNLFPNLSISVGPDAALVVRTRPDSTATNSSLFDVWFLERYGPGKEPDAPPEYYPDWNACADKLPRLLTQDMRNIEKIQRGMNSIGFKGSRTNPVQEVQVSNLHKVLHHYLYER